MEEKRMILDKSQHNVKKKVISPKGSKGKISLGNFLSYSVLSIWAFTTIFPLIWVLGNSFKTSDEIIDNSFNLPDSFNLENYINAFTEMKIGTSYINSLIISGSVVVLVIFFGGLASYVLARYNFQFF